MGMLRSYRRHVDTFIVRTIRRPAILPPHVRCKRPTQRRRASSISTSATTALGPRAGRPLGLACTSTAVCRFDMPIARDPSVRRRRRPPPIHRSLSCITPLIARKEIGTFITSSYIVLRLVAVRSSSRRSGWPGTASIHGHASSSARDSSATLASETSTCPATPWARSASGTSRAGGPIASRFFHLPKAPLFRCPPLGLIHLIEYRGTSSRIKQIRTDLDALPSIKLDYSSWKSGDVCWRQHAKRVVFEASSENGGQAVLRMWKMTRAATDGASFRPWRS